MLRRGINVNLREFHLHKICTHDILVLIIIELVYYNIQLLIDISKNFGWQVGLEPTTVGTTIRCSAN